jgi:hypothetical protein
VRVGSGQSLSSDEKAWPEFKDIVLYERSNVTLCGPAVIAASDSARTILSHTRACLDATYALQHFIVHGIERRTCPISCNIGWGMNSR